MSSLFAMITAVVACDTAPSPDLICKVTVDEEVSKECTGVPSLVDANLRLLNDGTFELTGQYDACHQIEDVQIEGTYQATPHDSGVDFELLAKRTVGGDKDVSEHERTIGLINMDSQTLKARFTDTAALIRSRGQMVGSAPSVPMVCSKN